MPTPLNKVQTSYKNGNILIGSHSFRTVIYVTQMHLNSLIGFYISRWTENFQSTGIQPSHWFNTFILTGKLSFWPRSAFWLASFFPSRPGKLTKTGGLNFQPCHWSDKFRLTGKLTFWPGAAFWLVQIFPGRPEFSVTYSRSLLAGTANDSFQNQHNDLQLTGWVIWE